MRKLRIAFLHVAPITGDIEHNRRLVEEGIKTAAGLGADWAVTPELCIPGYLFMRHIGADWILCQPDSWMQRFCRLVREHGLLTFLSHPEKDPVTNKMHNTVFVIDQQGEIIGKHRKIKALRGAEGWSTAGWEIKPVECDGVQTGILICADSYKNEVAQRLKDKGAEILVSPSSWGPGDCGPDGEWEQRSIDTGLPILVCNRSGIERGELDYRYAESVVAKDGQRLFTETSERSVVLSFDWDLDSMSMISEEVQRTFI